MSGTSRAETKRSTIYEILDLADQLKYDQKHGIPHPRLQGKTLAVIFSKNSTRTRISFEVGMFQLGGHALFLSNATSQISRGEPVQDTARVISRYCDGIMILTFDQQKVEDLAKYGSIPVINGLTGMAHPCQVLADLMTIREHKAKLEGLKICYIGDGNNMANSIIVGGPKCGMDISIACPASYQPHPDVLAYAETVTDAKFVMTQDPMEASKNADVIFTDVWASMGQEQEKAQREQAFAGFQVNSEMMKVAKPDCMIQHCLPAHRGEEITEEVFEGHAQEIFDEAENRLHAQKAVMALLMG